MGTRRRRRSKIANASNKGASPSESEVSRLRAQLGAASDSERLQAIGEVAHSNIAPTLAIELLTIALRDAVDDVRSAAVEGMGNLLEWTIPDDEKEVVAQALRALRDCALDASPVVRGEIAAIVDSVKGPYHGTVVDSETVRPLLRQLASLTIGRQQRVPAHESVKEDKMTASHSSKGRLTLDEAAEKLGVPSSTLQAWIEAGEVAVPRSALLSDRLSVQDFAALERHTLFVDIKSLFDEPDAWLDAPNLDFGGRTPRELIGTDREEIVRNFIDSVKHGITS